MRGTPSILDRLIVWSLERRFLVLLLALVVLVYGALTLERLPVDVLPDLDRPRVTILTDAHGLGAEEVEQQVSRPLEQAVAGATGVLAVRSQSTVGFSTVTIEFEWGTDPYRNRQVVQERLQLATAEMPPSVVPEMAPMSSIMGQVQLVGFRPPEGLPVEELRAVVDRVVRPRLLSVGGVAQVVVIGGARRELQVTPQAELLRRYGVSLEGLADAVADANVSASGGFLNQGDRGPLVTVTGRIRDVTDLESAVVRDDPIRPVRVSDVAAVEFGPAAQRTGTAGIDGSPGVALVVFKQPGADTVALARAVETELDALASALPDGVQVLPELFRQADFIERAVDNVIEAVVDGSLLVVLVLFVFLMDFRTTTITLTAIPLSLALSAIVFSWLGIDIDTMTLGGIAVAVGALVDDAVVDVENVFRRLREERGRPDPRSTLEVVASASAEVRRPIVIGTVVVAAAYLPLFALQGMEGRLFTPIGIAYVIAVVTSLFVALTVTPVLCYFLLPGAKSVKTGEPGRVLRFIHRVTAVAVRFGLRHGSAIAGGTVLVLLAAGTVLFSRGGDFLPAFDEGVAQVNLVLPPGTSLDTSDAYGLRMEQVALEVEGVAHVVRRTGRAEGDEHAMPTNVSEMIVTFDEGHERSRDEVLGELRTRITDAFPGVALSVEQPLAHLLSHLLSGVNAQVAIKITGDDLGALRRTADAVEARISGIDGVTDLLVEQQTLVERVEVRPRRDQLARLGVTVEELAHTVEMALEGEEVSRLLVGQTSYPIVLRLDAADRRDLDDLRGLRTESGHRVGDLADVLISRTPNAIGREDITRRIVVQHNVQGRALGEVVAEVEAALDQVRATLPEGYAIRLSGQFEARESAERVLLLLSIASVVLIFAAISAHFGSANLAFQSLAAIPMALAGAIVLVLATGQSVSIATLVGLVALGGIAARNHILLVDHYLHLMREEGLPFGPEMIVRAGQERMVPVLMTALTTGVALVPLVLSPGEPGREILYPVATVIVGGLLSTTLLDALLSPYLFHRFGAEPSRRLVPDPGAI